MPEPQQRKDATRGVLSVEAAAQATITKSIDHIARQAATLNMHPTAAAMLIGNAAALGVTKAREASAERAALSFERQTGLDARSVEHDEEARAEWATDGLRRRFVEEVQKNTALGLTGAVGYVAAAKAMRPAIERTVTTEVMHAWNAETRRQAVLAKSQVTETWHSELDACDECAGLDGQTVKAGEVFSYGDPPLHPHCRCYVSSSLERVASEERVSETRLKAAPEAAPIPSVAKPGSKAAALDHAVSEANRIGVANGVYNEEGMRSLTLHRGAFTGATPAEVEKIATGLAPAMNTGKVLPPIKVVLDSGDLVVTDGRHRMTAAAEAGAEHVHAIVSTYHRGKKLEREAIVRLGGMTRVKPSTDVIH